MTDFVAMGGYAAYVWGAYGLCAVVLIALLVLSQRRLKERETQVHALQPDRPRSSRAEATTSGASDHAS